MAAARLQALSAPSRATLWRSLQALGATRVVVALVLLAHLSIDGRRLRVAGDYPYLPVCLAYLGLAIAFALVALYWRRRFLAQLFSQLACDLAVIAPLYVAAGGARGGLAILFLFPLAASAILAPLAPALFGAVLVALFMLGDGVWRLMAMDSQHGLPQAALYGAAFVAVVVVASRMAAKLIGQEELTIRRGVEVDVQQAVNRLVMANIADGVLVADPAGRVSAANPAARRMLGLAEGELPFMLADVVNLAPLARAYADWRADPARGTVGVTVEPSGDAVAAQTIGPLGANAAPLAPSTRLQIRFAAVEMAGAEVRSDAGEGAGVERGVIFLQDVTAIENQAQQLKLASMGRLTASIAHEVRNPLSAIGHAAALLEEELDDAGHLRLLQIVGDNVTRVNRMVEDILQLSRKTRPQGGPLALDAFLADLTAEFIIHHGLPGDIVELSVVPGAAVRFDPTHLRAVVLNLLNNALRYASGGPRSIGVELIAASPPARRIELHVRDDGPGMSPEVRAHLFEPFYTTSSKGTGLGLFLARELCLNNEARLDYEYRFDRADGGRRSSGRFVITFAQAARTE